MGIDSIVFPHLGIMLPHVGQSFRIGSFTVMYYGLVVAAAMVAGVALAMRTAQKTGQDPDLYYRFALIGLILGVIGARVYYVLFSWDYYGSHLKEIWDIRGGGLAIYGGVITGVLTAVVFCRRNKVSVPVFLDTALPAVALGQAIGRWGNFFNREAFGLYTDSLFAMRLPAAAVSADCITEEMTAHLVTEDGISCIQAHPTFLYESIWNLCLVAVLLFVTYRVKKRLQGDVALLYMTGYALGRVWIEGLRTDQLLLTGTDLAVSQLLSAILAVSGILIIIWRHRKGEKT